MKDIGSWEYIMAYQLHLCNREIFSFHSDHHRAWTIWSALIKFPSPRNRISVQCMGLGLQLRHRQALALLISCLPFLLVSRMRFQAQKLPLATVWVFSYTLRIFRDWLVVIKQTAHNFGVSTSFSALEISDLPPVSVPAVAPILF